MAFQAFSPGSQLQRSHVRAGRAAVCGDPSGVGPAHGREHGPGAERRGGGPARGGRVLPAQRGHTGPLPFPPRMLPALPSPWPPPSRRDIVHRYGCGPYLGFEGFEGFEARQRRRPSLPSPELPLSQRGFLANSAGWAWSHVPIFLTAMLGRPYKVMFIFCMRETGS